MKSLLRTSLLTAAFAAALPSASLHASALASDNAGNYSGDYNSQNLGMGFTPFSLSNSTGSSSNGGTFIGNSTANGGGSGGINTTGSASSNSAFGLYSNSGTTYISRAFTTGGGNSSVALASGQTFSLALDNGYINTGSNVGLRLVNSSGATEFTFQFVGGNSNYTYINSAGTDAGTTTDSKINYTTGGLTLGFTVGDNNAYTLTVTPSGGATSTFTGTTADALSGFQVFNNAAGSGANYDLYFNSLSITGVGVPEPRTWLAGFCCLGVLGAKLRSRRVRLA